MSITTIAADVERRLSRILGAPVGARDDDGDWAVPSGGGTVWVRVDDDPQPHVRIWAALATDVSGDVVAEINHINGSTPWASLVWHDTGVVTAHAVLHPSSATRAALQQHVEAIAAYAADCGPMLATVFAAADASASLEVTPDVVTSLPPDGVFVFGSGASGAHTGGAALVARERFGAEPGVTEGPRGDSYALPTTQGLRVLADAASRFLRFAAAHPERRFWLTRVGCGHAGLAEPRVAALFADAPSNVVKPAGW